MRLIETEEGTMILELTIQQATTIPSKLSRIKSSVLIYDKEIVEEEAQGKNNKNNKRKAEIIAFSVELSKFKLSYSNLISQKPKSKEDRKKILEIASFVSKDESAKESLLQSKELPEEKLVEQLDIPKKFLKKHKTYLIAFSLLLNGPYTELKRYLLEGMV